MTTFTDIATGSLAVGKPLTSAIALALRNNPIAIAEGDASVPPELLQTRLLGTMATTSASIKSITGLTLTPYKFLLFIWNGVSQNATGGSFGVGTATSIVFSSPDSASHTTSGLVWVELSTGLAVGVSSTNQSPIPVQGVKIGLTGYTTATTTVSVNTTGTFDAGSVTCYGIK